MKNKIKCCCAYPFLYDENPLCDYEIAVDKLASMLGFCKSFCDNKNLENDIIKLIELVYHSNGSARGKSAITINEIKYLEEKIDYYNNEVKGIIKGFVLPQGGNLGGALHMARSQGKECVRKLFFVKNNGQKVDEILLDFLNMTTNYIFLLAVYANKINNIDEIEFISKSY